MMMHITFLSGQNSKEEKVSDQLFSNFLKKRCMETQTQVKYAGWESNTNFKIRTKGTKGNLGKCSRRILFWFIGLY